MDAKPLADMAGPNLSEAFLKRHKFIAAPFLFGAVFCLLLCWPTLPGWGFSGAAIAFGLNITLGTVAIIVTFGAALGLPLFLIVLAVKRDAATLQRTVAVALFAILGCTSGLSGFAIRKHFFGRLAMRSAPLTEAIEAFRRQRGAYPNDLLALVPDFLPRIPHTGMLGYGPYKYRRATKDSLFRSYEISVQCGGLGINWDVFMYWPERQYPGYMYGGTAERIYDWAYVHE